MHMHKTTHLLVHWKIINLALCLVFVSSSCSGVFVKNPTQYPTSIPEIPSIDALITFRVSLPEPLPAGDSIYLTVVDEVTGLGLGTQRYVMESEDETNYFVILPFVLGSIIKYRYQREGKILALEHQPDGRPVRYRLYHVEGPGAVNDIVNRWTDTRAQNNYGMLRGQVIDKTTGEPLHSIMISVGGAQVFSEANGSFTVHQLEPGVHNLVAYSINGEYLPYQQGASILPGNTTNAHISLLPTELVTIKFYVTLPDNTPPDIPIRLAGNLNQLGNTFTDLTGGVNSTVSRMPTLTAMPDGRFSLEISLPAGVDLRYKYSLGDGFWNAERTATGDTRLRQIIVPYHDLEIHDKVDSWTDSDRGIVNFNIIAPSDTPLNEIVYIQLNPGFGWMEPLPMWGRKKGNNGTIEWEYTIFNNLDMFDVLRYRLCLAGECDIAVGDSSSMNQENEIILTQSPQTIDWQITAWSSRPLKSQAAIVPNTVVFPRDDNFMAGFALTNIYRPAWESKIPFAISDIKSLYANWIVFQPAWSYSNLNPLILEYSPLTSPTLDTLSNWISQSHMLDLHTAIFPRIAFNEGAFDLQDISPLTELDWFEQYSNMVFNYAIFSHQTSAEALIIGDVGMVSTPSSLDLLQSPSFDTTLAWVDLIRNVREHYSGKIMWVTNYPANLSSLPLFIEEVDEILILWDTNSITQNRATKLQIRQEAIEFIDHHFLPLWNRFHKPITLAVSSPTNNLTEQMETYNAILLAINERSWLNGIISMDYYPILPIQDISSSVQGKPASGVLWYWFSLLLNR